MTDERRHFERIPFGTEVVVRTVEEQYLGKLLDISLKGALIEFPSAPQSFTEGKIGWLKLRLEDDTTLEFTVKNVHREGAQVGVKFTEFSIDSLSHLRRLLELNSGDADLVKDELHFLIDAE